MKTAILVALATLTAVALYQATSTKGPTIKETIAFGRWARKYNKFYRRAEFSYRMNIFTQKFRSVQLHNQSNASYTKAINQFSDLTKEEFSAKYLGLRVSNSPKNYKYLPVNQNADSVDWRTKGVVNAVKDQGQCGSCWAFSTIASLEAAYVLQKKGNLSSFSEQQLVDCSTSFGNQGCNGGWMDYAFQYLQKNGPELESDYVYTAKDGKCQASAHKGYAKLHSYTDVPKNDPAQLTAAVDKSVISVAVDANNWSEYSSGIFSDCGVSLDHGVAVVGYGVEGGKNFWIVRNSWSDSWGESGYIRVLSTGKKGKGTCGILTTASYPVF